MAELPSQTIQAAVLAVLRVVKSAGFRNVTRTALIKFVYLLDCYFAEEHLGRNFSGANWYFHTFGPFATDLAVGIESMAHVGMIQREDGEFDDREFTTYWLGEFPVGPELSELGLSARSALRLNSNVKLLAKDLPRLLDYVYFNTKPMEGAKPGSELSFKSSASVKPVSRVTSVHVSDHQKLLQMLEVVNRFRLREPLSASVASNSYDEEYSLAVEWLEDAREEVENLHFDAQVD